MTVNDKDPRMLYRAAASVYVPLVGILRSVARDLGYALAVHGSLATDLDLVAVPWVEGAAPAEQLIEALRACIGGNIRTGPYASCGPCADGGIKEGCPHVTGMANPATQPHGRLSWSIHFVGESGPYLDVSVMPRARYADLMSAARAVAEGRILNLVTARYVLADALKKLEGT